MGRIKIQNYGNCELCGTLFEKRKPNGASFIRKRFCSPKCSGAIGGKANLGKVTPLSTRLKISQAQRGPLGNNWKGGEWSSQPQSERKSSRYRTLRKEIFVRDNFTCVLCKHKGGTLELDHILSYSKHPELRFEQSNLRTLCRECHLKTPTFAKG